jgi:hypothetical protein
MCLDAIISDDISILSATHCSQLTLNPTCVTHLPMFEIIEASIIILTPVLRYLFKHTFGDLYIVMFKYIENMYLRTHIHLDKYIYYIIYGTAEI